MTRPLLECGAVSQVDIMRLQRDVAKYCGEKKAYEAQIDRIEAAIQEADKRLRETEYIFRNEARSDLSDTRARLSALVEGQVGLADRVRLAEVRSPVRGVVKSLHANTLGRSEEHTSELQSRGQLVCRLLLEKKNITPRV